MAPRQRLRKVGTILIVAAVALPAATYLGARAWMAFLAAHDPVPNQGAMVVAFLAVCASVIVALVALATGITMVVRGRNPSPERGP